MYRFQIIAQTQPGESIALVGSTPELGEWDITKAIPLSTNSDRFPLWSTDQIIDFSQSLKLGLSHNPEYKYIWFDAQGVGTWESIGENRWVPLKPEVESTTIIIDDGAFGYGQPYPFGYQEQTPINQGVSRGDGLKILVIGSSVALGYKAWLLRGWAWQLGQTLDKMYGHQLINVSQLGANVNSTIARFPSVVTPLKPDVVIISLSLGNEGLAFCRPYERRAVQRRFESGLQQLIKMTRELGAIPILGSVYPHNDYHPEHDWLLKDTHQRMLSWNVPILNWLNIVDNSWGRWKHNTSFDPAHPNTLGHRLMYQAINLDIFSPEQLKQEKLRLQQESQTSIYFDNGGFEVFVNVKDKSLRIKNQSPYNYTIANYCEELQTVLKQKAGLVPGLYITQQISQAILPFFAVNEDGSIETTIDVAPGLDVEYTSVFNLFAPGNAELLYYDGNLGIIKQSNTQLWVINETHHEYNIHPMWKEIRHALKAMPTGIYEDPLYPEAPVRTMMIDQDGLASRVRIPTKSAVLLEYQCKLSERSRIAIVPLGARCAARMLLYKIGYDGPAYPFDLTRTTNLGDVADMITNGFQDMWNPELLDYNAQENRIYHRKWSGLSFAHEVEETDDPINDMGPVYHRMFTRYQARSRRFWHTLSHGDEFLFVRNGYCDRGGVIDLLHKLTLKCHGKPFRLLVISPESSEQYADLPNVIHYNIDFNPDKMYDDEQHWWERAGVMKNILDSLGISSKNLFWCPPN
jgi:lysophospholipase L1-like esterase